MIAAITAGGRVDGALAEAIGTPVKALAPFGRVALIDAAIAAARGAGATSITVIGGDEVRAHCSARVDAVVAESLDGRENIRRAMASAEGQPLLLLTSDLPFVEATAVADFLGRAADADVAFPLASESAYRAAYPGAPPHLTNLGGQRIASGSAVYFAPGSALRVLDLALRLFDARKSLLRMATLLGPALLARFALGTLRIEHVESRAERRLGIRARAVRNASPTLCFDVDTIDDYRYALALAER